MGLRFRKSVKMGPIRVNFSKSGVGYSVGGKGFRATKKAGGGYRTTASIPGTGISYVKDYSEKSKGSSTGADTIPKKSSGGKKPGKGKLIVGGLAALCIVGAIAGGGGDKEDQDPDASVQASNMISISSASTSAPLPGGAEIIDTSAPGDISAPDVSSAAPSADAGAKPEPKPDTTPEARPASSAQPTEPPAVKATDTTKPVDQTYIGNSNTMKFHKPICSYVKEITEDNKVTLDSRDSAISKGYQPCKHCNP